MWLSSHLSLPLVLKLIFLVKGPLSKECLKRADASVDPTSAKEKPWASEFRSRAYEVDPTSAKPRSDEVEPRADVSVDSVDSFV